MLTDQVSHRRVQFGTVQCTVRCTVAVYVSVGLKKEWLRWVTLGPSHSSSCLRIMPKILQHEPSFQDKLQQIRTSWRKKMQQQVMGLSNLTRSGLLGQKKS